MKKLYPCDPNKNINCPKKGCQETCFSTTKKAYAKIQERIERRNKSKWLSKECGPSQNLQKN